MKFTALLVLGCALIVGPAYAQKVFIDYDPDYDGSRNETFAWKKTPETSVNDRNPLLHSRIVNGIEYYLTLSGATEDEDNPDVYVTYHTNTEKRLSFNTDHFGYGYPGGWSRYGYHSGSYTGVARTTVTTYEKGTLIVDVWDAASNQLVWRGTAANISVTDNPTKMNKRIDKALKKMVNEWKKVKEQIAKKKAG